jgi:hypothetical protein
MIKTSDTNRFIRADANAALDAAAENMSVAKAVAILSKTGLQHKHVAARSSAGRIIANMVSGVLFYTYGDQ